MAGVRISELPVVNVFQDSDVLVLNENNLETSSIEMRFFVSSLTSKDLVFTGEVEFDNAIKIDGTAEFNNTVEFNNQVEFKDPVIFYDAISIVGPSGIALNDLTDVDTETTPPIQGDTLVYDNANKVFKPGKGGSLNAVVEDISPQLGGDLDVNGFSIVSRNNGNIDITPDGTGKVTLGGHGGSSGSISFVGATRSRVIDLTVPEEVDVVNYTLTLPPTKGQAGYVLKTDGTGKTVWAEETSGPGGSGGIEYVDLSVRTGSAKDGGELSYSNLNGEFLFNPADLTPYLTQLDLDLTSINVHTDVDTETVEPTDGQALIWDDAGGNWVPGDVSIDNYKIGELLDVDTTSVDEGDILIYDLPSQKWIASRNNVPNTLQFRGPCDITKPILDSANDDVDDDPDDRLTGYFWVNGGGITGPVHSDWVGLTEDSVGFEYVVWTVSNDFAILGNTGNLQAVTEIQAGTGIVVDDTPDATQPTISLADTTVTPGSYNLSNITVDQQGRITAIDSGTSGGDSLEDILAAYLPLSGGTMTDFITLHADPSADLHAATKQYVDGEINLILGNPDNPNDGGILEGYVETSGDHMYGALTLGPTLDDTLITLDNTTGAITTGEITLPVVDGTSGQTIVTDGSGNLTWGESGASVNVGSNPPSTAEEGDLWFNDVSGELYVYFIDEDSDEYWISVTGAGGGGGGASVTVDSKEPDSGEQGDLWSTLENKLHIYINSKWNQVVADVDIDSYPSLSTAPISTTSSSSNPAAVISTESGTPVSY